MTDIKRASLNKVVGKEKALTVSKKEFLVALGVSSSVADKLVRLEGASSWCIIDNNCESNCNGNKPTNGLSLDSVESVIKKGYIKEADIDKGFIEKIRKL